MFGSGLVEAESAAEGVRLAWVVLELQIGVPELPLVSDRGDVEAGAGLRGGGGGRGVGADGKWLEG